ncbi:hypothetical protein [Halalkalicoccus sp. NIPERK01]|uniref:hypothetical protein n=1 Tax=Halalkalicoccus sp. NIPERK01 TaxID=3053469 RepID=UPI00256EF60A|nr:hypothetical protein [Halalkalicoccus sp. NIPERK01]MDL5363418.1 hypothetical protein [Halalkalicoccus sp. NIPERK01]
MAVAEPSPSVVGPDGTEVNPMHVEPTDHRTEQNASLTRDDLRAKMWEYYMELVDFFFTEEFQAVYEEMNELPETERPQYVKEVLLNDDVLKERGVDVPAGILIQRSSFGDRRPTLFCLKKYLPKAYQDAFVWQNVNLTFDNDHDTWPIADGESAWNKPINVDLQDRIHSGEFSVETSS